MFLPGYEDETPVDGLTYPSIQCDLLMTPVKSTYIKNQPGTAYQIGRVLTKLYNPNGTPFHGCPRHLIETAID